MNEKVIIKGTKWFEDDKGNVSTVRLLSLPAGIVGILITIAGVVAMFLNNPSAGTAMGIGMGMLGLALGGKVGQKYAERG